MITHLKIRSRSALFSLLSLLVSLSSYALETRTTPEQAQAGSLLFNNGNGGYTQALTLNADAQVRIHGMTAQIELTQHFKNDSNQWKEAIYVFPLPEDAAVFHMEIQIDERIIVGEIKEKKEAKAIYQKAKREGKVAALTEQERPNLFTQSVANIPPHAVVTVKLTYQHRIQYDMGAFAWRLPMTLTPRYIPQAATTAADLQSRFGSLASEQNTVTHTGWSLPTASVPDAHRITPPMQSAQQPRKPQMTLNIELASGLSLNHVRGAYHEVTVTEQNGIHNIRLKQASVPMDRDFVLEWLPDTGKSPSAGVFTETVNGEYYASLMLVPPQSTEPVALERDIVFVIDTSGSMAGVSIRQARQSLIMALDRLKPGDRFNIIEFNSHHTELFTQLENADTANIDIARRWVGRLNADGGTEMLPALDTALKSFNSESRLQQLVFITDGAIGNENQLFKRIQSGLGKTRLFAVGIGSAPNAYFMKKAAEFGRGTATYIGDVTEVAGKMSELFMKLETALVTNIQIDWGAEAEQYPAQVGELYAGEPLLLTAKLKTPSSGVAVSGITQKQSWSRFLQPDPNSSQAGIARNWARAKIESLEDSKTRGADSSEIRQSVLTLALRHQLLSAYTSFVAVEQTISRPIMQSLDSQPIANTMPKGSLQAVPTSRTATPSMLFAWLGTLAMAGFLGLRRRAVREI